MTLVSEPKPDPSEDRELAHIMSQFFEISFFFELSKKIFCLHGKSADDLVRPSVLSQPLEDVCGAFQRNGHIAFGFLILPRAV